MILRLASLKVPKIQQSSGNKIMLYLPLYLEQISTYRKPQRFTCMKQLCEVYEVITKQCWDILSKIPPPPNVTLNEHNISQFQNGLFPAYKPINRSDSSYNSPCGSFAKYFSVSNDDIQKFSMKLNGVMIRTLNNDL